MNGDFIENLRLIRLKRNFSQEFVAEQIGVSLSSYQRYEGGKVPIDFLSVVKLASLYKITIDELVHFGNPEYSAKEPEPVYLKSSKMSVIIELDGLENTLTTTFKKLTAMNVALNQTSAI